MKKYIFIILIILFNYNIINTQEWESVLELSYGNKQQQVGIDDSPIGYGSITCIAFDKNNYLYISDNINNRILVFNDKLKFSKEIKSNNRYLASTGRILIDDDLNIWGFSSSSGFKIDNNGKVLVEGKDELLPYHVGTWDTVNLYNNKLIGKVEYKKKLFAINEKGKEADLTVLENERDNRINDLAISRSISQEKLNVVKKLNDKVKAKSDKIKSFIDEKGRLYATDDNEFAEYAKIQREVKKENNTSRSKVEFKDEPFSLKHYNGIKGKYIGLFVGIDNTLNTYWNSYDDKSIKVFDKYGQLLKEIIFKDLYDKSSIASPFQYIFNIDQKGNIYYAWMHSDVGFRLYQYKRTW